MSSVAISAQACIATVPPSSAYARVACFYIGDNDDEDDDVGLFDDAMGADMGPMDNSTSTGMGSQTAEVARGAAGLAQAWARLLVCVAAGVGIGSMVVALGVGFAGNGKGTMADMVVDISAKVPGGNSGRGHGLVGWLGGHRHVSRIEDLTFGKDSRLGMGVMDSGMGASDDFDGANAPSCDARFRHGWPDGQRHVGSMHGLTFGKDLMSGIGMMVSGIGHGWHWHRLLGRLRGRRHRHGLVGRLDERRQEPDGQPTGRRHGQGGRLVSQRPGLKFHRNPGRPPGGRFDGHRHGLERRLERAQAWAHKAA